MLRVEMSDGTNAVIMRLEGRLCGEYAQHVRTLIRRCNLEMGLVVDLTKVTLVDSVGESVLSLLERLGADFVAENAYSLNLCERLHLPWLFPHAAPGEPQGHLDTDACLGPCGQMHIARIRTLNNARSRCQAATVLR